MHRLSRASPIRIQRSVWLHLNLTEHDGVERQGVLGKAVQHLCHQAFRAVAVVAAPPDAIASPGHEWYGSTDRGVVTHRILECVAVAEEQQVHVATCSVHTPCSFRVDRAAAVANEQQRDVPGACARGRLQPEGQEKFSVLLSKSTELVSLTIA